MKKVKRHPIEWEQIFPNNISDKGLVPEYQRNQGFNSRKQRHKQTKTYNGKLSPACNNGYHKKAREQMLV